MTEEQLIKTNDYLLMFASITLLAGLSMMVFDREEKVIYQQTEVIESEPEPRAPREQKETKQPHPVIAQEKELRNIWQSVDITFTTIETEYLGIYFLTAYSDEETNSRQTASGIEVHYSDDNYEPTTCAIDRRYHHFGDLFMIDGHVYVAEDTGAFSGLWIDCFVETMEEVHGFNTRYDAVYSVEYVENELPADERKILHERFNSYLHHRSDSSRCPFRNDR